MNRTMPKVFAIALILAMAFNFMPATIRSAQAISPDVVISQLYGGGGNSGATYAYDFVELYNLGTTTVSLAGWSIQYASATGTGAFGANSGQLTPLSGSIAPGQYYLIQEATTNATIGLLLPAPDITDSTPINLSGTAGKVALVTSTASLGCNGGSIPCSAAQLALIKDLVGFGTGASGANFFEGAGAAPTLSNTTAALRKGNGSIDTDNNNADFVAGPPNPRNSAPADTAPVVASTVPANGAIEVPVDSNITINFSEPVNVSGPWFNLSCATSGVHDATVAGGPTTFTLNPGTNFVDGELCTLTVYAANVTDQDLVDPPDNMTINFVAGFTTVAPPMPIGKVNGPVADGTDGTTHISPYKDQIVKIQGVIYETTLQAITNTTDTYKGFFIQNTAETADGDPKTSDGIFVFMNKTDAIPGYTVHVGDEVVITGKVSEYYNMTELVAPFTLQELVRSGLDIDAEVPPVVANPPADLAEANRYWERLQGMRVQAPANSIVLGGRNVFSPADAEIWLANPDSTVAQRTDPYTMRAFRDAHPLDDNYDPNIWDGNGYRILIGSLGIKALENDAQALIDPARSFDTLAAPVSGGINYTFSKYRIEVDNQPVFNEGPDPSTNTPPQVYDRSIHYSISDYNLENLYDYRDNPFSGCDFNGNSGCPKTGPFLAAVAPPYDYVPASDAEYQARLNDISLEIINDLHSPDILMVQEVENQDICTVTGGALTCGTTDNADGKPDVLQELALKIASHGGPAYDAAFDRDSSDLRGIAPSFLYRTDRVELLPAAGDPVLGQTPTIDGYTSVPYDGDISNPKTLNAVLPAGVSACETAWVFPRAADVALFRIYSTSIGVGSHRDVYVINNHFKSGPDSCVGHRTEQAKFNAALVAYIQSQKPDARIVLGGDLNVYPRPDDPFAPIGQPGSSDQLGSLYNSSLGLKNLWEVLANKAPQSAYSYVYLGMAQTLDQMFINQSMLADLQEYRIAHINSDFPADYPGDVARGTSDHDPNVAVFTINDPPTANAGGPYTVNEGASVTLNATASDPENGPLSYAWDLDNNGSFETAGQSVTFSAAALTAPATYTVKVRVTDNGGLTATAATTVSILFNWNGFFQPVDNLPTLNSAKAGSAIPVKFSLGGNKGLSLFATGYPASKLIVCKSGAVLDDIEQTVTAGGSSLSYDPRSMLYTYVWKTDKSWAGTCRQLVVQLVDGTLHLANFLFK